jgi:hypothetical protein
MAKFPNGNVGKGSVMLVAGLVTFVVGLVLCVIASRVGGAVLSSSAAFCIMLGAWLVTRWDRKRKAPPPDGSLSLGLDTKERDHPPKG